MSRLALVAALVLASGSAALLARPPEARRDVETSIRSGGTLLVCVVSNYAGINLRDPRTGRLSGLDIEMSKRFAKELGVKAEYVETDFREFTRDLENSRCHIAMMGIWISQGRAARVDFAAPYLASGAYVAVARANRQLRNWSDVNRPETTVAVLDTPDLMQRSSRVLPEATLVALKPTGRDFRGSAAAEVMSGRSDALIVDHSMAAALRRNDTWARLISPPRFIPLAEIAYAVPKGEPRWLATVNDFVSRIKTDGSLRQAADRYGLKEMSVPR